MRPIVINRIQQLQEQMQSATLCQEALEAAASRHPEPGVAAALLEAREAEAACRAELQDASPESLARMAA
jgi:hypothetical protein